MGVKSIDNILLSHLVSEVPSSYLNALGNIYNVKADSSITGSFKFSDTRVIQYLLELQGLCKQTGAYKRHPVCAKLL